MFREKEREIISLFILDERERQSLFILDETHAQRERESPKLVLILDRDQWLLGGCF